MQIKKQLQTADEDPFKGLLDKIDALRKVEPDFIPEDINAALLTDFDAGVSAMVPSLTDSEILVGFFNSINISDENEESINACDALDEKPLENPGKTQLLIALEMLQNFSLFAINGEEIQIGCLNIKRSIDRPFTKK